MSAPKTTRYTMIEDKITPDGFRAHVQTIENIVTYGLDGGLIGLNGPDFAMVVAPAPGHNYTFTKDED